MYNYYTQPYYHFLLTGIFESSLWSNLCFKCLCESCHLSSYSQSNSHFATAELCFPLKPVKLQMHLPWLKESQEVYMLTHAHQGQACTETQVNTGPWGDPRHGNWWIKM
jgi:hypothetical protein